MRLTSRHRHRQRAGQVPRIAISQEEITADLIYPARQTGTRRGPEHSR